MVRVLSLMLFNKCPGIFPVSEDEKDKRKSDGYSLFVELIIMKSNNENDLKTGILQRFLLEVTT